jgi:hypothetical protein
LQDCALLQQTHPSHLLLKQDVFQTTLFTSFAERVRATVVEAVNPREVVLQQAMPKLADAIDAMRGSLGNNFRDLRQSVLQETSSIRTDIIPVIDKLREEHRKNSSAIRTVASTLGILASSLQTISSGVFETRLRLPDAEEDNLTGAVSGAEGSAGGRAGGMMDGLASRLESAGINSRQVLSDLAATDSQQRAPGPNVTPTQNNSSAPCTQKFVMESNHATVLELWKEWEEGVFGRLSVKEMIAEGYVKSEAQRKLFSRRKIIVDEIQRLAKERTEPELDVVKSLDVYLASKKMSISKLQDVMRQRAKEGQESALWL